MLSSSSDEDGAADPYAHTRRARSKRIQFDHAGAQYCILRDYLGPTPKFADKSFQEMFRISKTRMQRLLEDIGNAPPASSDFFLKSPVSSEGASFKAKVLIAIKTLAYGVAPHCFRDYFQMSKWDENGEFDRKYISIDGFPGENSMNPHVIIEFSWTNKIEMEIWKLQEQVAGHIHALGDVRLGFLIKAKPAEGAKSPTVLDRTVPLSGFGVYRFRSGETKTLPDPILEYRVGSKEAETVAIEISGTDLGRSNQEHGISFTLSAIRKSCEKSGLVFHAEATVQATHRSTTAG